MEELDANKSADGNSAVANELLEQYNHYIVVVVWHNGYSILRGIMPPEQLPDAMNDLAQNVRLQLWLAIRQKLIVYLKAYIRRIVRTEAIKMAHKYQPASPLSVNEEGELDRGQLLLAPGEDMRDPLEEIEQKEGIDDRFLARAAESIEKLSPRQQRAMICLLKDQIESTFPLLEALRNRGMDIESVQWPEEKEEMHRLKASLSATRNKLHFLRECSGTGALEDWRS